MAVSIDHPLSKFYEKNNNFLKFKEECSKTGTTEEAIANAAADPEVESQPEADESQEEKDKKDAETLLPSVISMIDRLAKKNIIHANKAGNLKSGLTRRVTAL